MTWKHGTTHNSSRTIIIMIIVAPNGIIIRRRWVGLAVGCATTEPQSSLPPCAVTAHSVQSPKFPSQGKKTPLSLLRTSVEKVVSPPAFSYSFFVVVAVIINHIEICTVLSVCPSSVSLCVSICLYRSISLHLMIDGETSQRVDE